MLTPVSNMKGEDEEDTRLLEEMAIGARNYITSFHWCPPIREMYFAFGVGFVIALFLFEFTEKIDGTDDWLWVVIGDLPPVYMVVLPDASPQQALETYCLLMEDWIEAVRNNGNFKEVYPVSAPRTVENADLLESRLGFLRREIIPDASPDAIILPGGGTTDGS
ncbi:MAG TPA: hypothetical protein VMF67_09030 [Rhizomicrobium sp.]|nr:hypothetical protein [Rhizomicrobium sp.]